MKILVSGASGLVGRELVRELIHRQHEVIPMVRDRNKQGVYWNPESDEIDLEALEGFDALIHLAGENISAQRWNESFKQKILESRTRGTQLIAQSLARLKQPPKHFLSASAVGYYGDSGSQELTEQSAAGASFLADVCKQWEAQADLAPASVRIVKMRIGVVLSSEGGALQKMLPAFRLGLGGRLGSGEQFLPWIDLEDVVSAMIFLLEHSELRGAFNLCAPQPVSQSVFAEKLCHELHRPGFFHTPEALLRLAVGSMADELLLASFRVVPKKLLESGFHFKFSALENSLKKWVKT